MIRPFDVSNTVQAEPVEALRQAQGERFKLQGAGSIVQTSEGSQINLTQAKPLRLAYPDLLKQTTHAVVTRPEEDALHAIAHVVAARVPEPDGAAVQSLIVDELRRLHEGVLARYGLRPSEFAAWKKVQVER